MIAQLTVAAAEGFQCFFVKVIADFILPEKLAELSVIRRLRPRARIALLSFGLGLN
jgi:hypothetical protein